ncbi:MAG: hypothetical protein OXE94_04970 [Aestuariivita sp.]|nr:hypothetical protein [Aestuariivita sp.]MCY4201931.1 hypothetical protein [Aestuariivita sp.]MCY4288817.1 hypothetical protein [Aestuariivita sp.]MCY4345262.1 hypothetical protein [Aestuariivita sp.]
MPDSIGTDSPNPSNPQIPFIVAVIKALIPALPRQELGPGLGDRKGAGARDIISSFPTNGGGFKPDATPKHPQSELRQRRQEGVPVPAPKMLLLLQ